MTCMQLEVIMEWRQSMLSSVTTPMKELGKRWPLLFSVDQSPESLLHTFGLYSPQWRVSGNQNLNYSPICNFKIHHQIPAHPLSSITRLWFVLYLKSIKVCTLSIYSAVLSRFIHWIFNNLFLPVCTVCVRVFCSFCVFRVSLHLYIKKLKKGWFLIFRACPQLNGISGGLYKLKSHPHRDQTEFTYLVPVMWGWHLKLGVFGRSSKPVTGLLGHHSLTIQRKLYCIWF